MKIIQTEKALHLHRTNLRDGANNTIRAEEYFTSGKREYVEGKELVLIAAEY